jgi:hypothetical protein
MSRRTRSAGNSITPPTATGLYWSTAADVMMHAATDLIRTLNYVSVQQQQVATTTTTTATRVVYTLGSVSVQQMLALLLVSAW